MADELVYISGSDNRPMRSDRRNMHTILLGLPEDAEGTIAELHLKRYCEVRLWSRPLTFHEI